MELRELGDRLFRLHAALILACFVVGVLGGLAVHLRDKPEYQANVTFVMGAQDPQSAEGAAVLADTARGIATGPILVARAISEAGARRNALMVAKAINVQTMGSSGVLLLSVTDPNPRVAVKLANALADGVVSTRVGLIQNAVASSLRNLREQQASTDAQIRQLSGQAQRLAAKIAATPAGGGGQNPAVAQLDELQVRLTSLQNLATQIAVQRNDLAAQLGPKTTVVDRAVSALPVPGRMLDDALLGGVIGLVLGVAIAAARETARPSLVGAEAIARESGAPLLGEMNTLPDAWTLAALPDAGTYVELAADSKHAHEVRFAALEVKGRGRARVRMLTGPLNRLRFHPPRITGEAGRAGDNGHPADLAPAGAPPPFPDAPDGGVPRTGLVVAVPRVVKAADLNALSNFIWISGWILLGVIVYSAPRTAGNAVRRGSGPVTAQRGGPVDTHVEVDA